MKKNRLLIVLLIFIIVFLAIVTLFVGKNPQETPTYPTSTPSPVAPPTNPPHPSLSVKRQIIKKLPKTTDGYTIQYLPKSDVFLVLILLNPYQKYKDEAAVWFVQNEATDLSSLNIQWDSVKGVVPTD